MKSQENGKPQNKRVPGKWIAAAAVCLVLIAAVAAAWFCPRQLPAADPILPAAAMEEPGGPRKFLNYNGCQYVFLENGTPYALPEEQLGAALGTLEHEIIIGREDHLKDDFAATFAVGGTLWAVNTYDPAFRLAVQLDGTTYLCEKSGHTDGTSLDAAAYFEQAGFADRVQSIDLCDHSGTEVLKTLKGRKAEKLLEQLTRIEPAELTDEQYGQIGQAQGEGESFLVVFRLNDATSFQMYVIPKLSIAMLGNDRFLLPDSFAGQAGKFFDGLQQGPLTTQ